MKKAILCIALYSMGVFSDEYPWKTYCPSGGDNPNIVGDGFSNAVGYWVDNLGFAQCNCTSYAASKLVESGIPGFNNTYRLPSGVSWGDGGHWGIAAKSVQGSEDIVVDRFPIPGDVAYWVGTESNRHGHVAFVEKVPIKNIFKHTRFHEKMSVKNMFEKIFQTLTVFKGMLRYDIPK